MEDENYLNDLPEENNNDVVLQFTNMLIERNLFETRLYDDNSHFSVTINLNYQSEEEIPDDFWDPIIVHLSEEHINNMKTVIQETECIICNESRSVFKQVSCCKNCICTFCTENWFNTSVYCPFCKHDQRC